MQRVEGVLESKRGAVEDCLWGRGTGGVVAGAGLMGVEVVTGIAEVESAVAQVVSDM